MIIFTANWISGEKNVKISFRLEKKKGFYFKFVHFYDLFFLTKSHILSKGEKKNNFLYYIV